MLIFYINLPFKVKQLQNWYYMSYWNCTITIKIFGRNPLPCPRLSSTYHHLHLFYPSLQAYQSRTFGQDNTEPQHYLSRLLFWLRFWLTYCIILLTSSTIQLPFRNPLRYHLLTRTSVPECTAQLPCLITRLLLCLKGRSVIHTLCTLSASLRLIGNTAIGIVAKTGSLLTSIFLLLSPVYISLSSLK